MKRGIVPRVSIMLVLRMMFSFMFSSVAFAGDGDPTTPPEPVPSEEPKNPIDRTLKRTFVTEDEVIAASIFHIIGQVNASNGEQESPDESTVKMDGWAKGVDLGQVTTFYGLDGLPSAYLVELTDLSGSNSMGYVMISANRNEHPILQYALEGLHPYTKMQNAVRDGAMATGWLQQGSTWYYLNTSTGAMYAGQWLTTGGYSYYFYSSGAMAKNWFQIGTSWYYGRTSTNVPATGPEGARLQSGTWTIGGKAYNFNSSGVCTNP